MANDTKAPKTRKKRTPPPENETAAQRFSRLGTVRLAKARKAVKNLASLAGKAYESTPEQRNLLFNTLKSEFLKLEESFKKGGKVEEPEVKL